MAQEDREDLDDPHSLWLLEGPADLAIRGVQKGLELLAIQAIPLLLYLRNGWWRSRRLGLPLVLADQVDPGVLAVRGLKVLGNPSHPLSRCNPALLSGLEVHPARADLEVLVFLEILAIQKGLLFLLGQTVLEVHRYPSLLWVRSALPVRGILVLLAVP